MRVDATDGDPRTDRLLDTVGLPIGTRCGFLAATTASSAAAFAAAADIEPVFILTSSELISLGPSRFRQLVLESGVDVVAVHSRVWSRQICPQLFTAALALAPAKVRLIVDDDASQVRRVGSLEAALALTGLPIDIGAGILEAAWETVRHLRKARQSEPTVEFHQDVLPGRPSILVIWRSHDAGVGGSATHLSGILGGFRKAGFEVVLLTTAEPVPDQILRSVDVVKTAPPLPGRARLTTDLERLAVNRQMRTLGIRVCRDLGPSFIYQRHALLLDAGTDISAACRVPMLLEWNSSEVWAHANWGSPGQLGRVFDPVLRPLRESMERRSVTHATRLLAVSRHAARMAQDAGAAASRVLRVPNGVDIDGVVPEPVNPQQGGSKIGWIGSFGPWHGATVLVEALALLPSEVELLMIGDGVERLACESLAQELGVWHRIEWAGSVSHASALERLGGCDVLASPHVPLPRIPFFGSPTKIYEYMALAKPIVASRLEQLEEVFEDGRTALLVSPGDARELAKAIKQILDAPDRGREMGMQARWEAEARHSWDERVCSVLENIEGERSKTRR